MIAALVFVLAAVCVNLCAHEWADVQSRRAGLTPVAHVWRTFAQCCLRCGGTREPR